jgi:toxin ParE1/3/4
MWKRSPLTLPLIPDPTPARSRRIITSTKTLSDFPMSGRKVPEFDEENIRELIAYSYRIIYAVEKDEVIIAAVIHGRRML